MHLIQEGRQRFTGAFVVLLLAIIILNKNISFDSIQTNDFIRREMSLIISLGVCFLLLKHFGIHLLDEAKPQTHLFTRIHGTWYDLATFKHPGGPISLSLIKDRDGTALFKSHHLLSTLDIYKMLKKYTVPKEIAHNLNTLDAKDDGGHYVWTGFDNDAFVQDMKELLHSYFGPCSIT